LELLHNRRGATHVKKFLLETTPLVVKTCGESEFDIFEAKKRFSDSGKAWVLKRKVAKIAFSLQYTVPWIKEAFFSL
jgi:hypothetical protein